MLVHQNLDREGIEPNQNGAKASDGVPLRAETDANEHVLQGLVGPSHKAEIPPKRGSQARGLDKQSRVLWHIMREPGLERNIPWLSAGAGQRQGKQNLPTTLWKKRGAGDRKVHGDSSCPPSVTRA